LPSVHEHEVRRRGFGLRDMRAFRRLMACVGPVGFCEACPASWCTRCANPTSRH